MIRDISDLLKGIMEEEKAKLDKYSLNHRPTIGEMYEGLTSNILERAIPESFGLQFRHGIIHDGQGEMSGEIDCMLVKGDGERIPYTNSYKWHVKDVIAVIEVKKNLYSNDLKDSFEHLRDIMKSYGSYVQQDKSGEKFNVNPARKAFSEATGIIPPPHSDVDKMELWREMLYHTFIIEQLSPIRIVLGYHGFKKEGSLREALYDFLSKNQITFGFGVGSFPQLIVCGKHSLIKINGFPYSTKIDDSGFWNFYASSNANPILLILELIWTKLSNEINIENLWGNDLYIENFALFLSGIVKTQDDKTGWEYKYTPIDEKILENREKTSDWSPIFVSNTQFIIFNRLCNEEISNINDQSIIKFITSSGENPVDFFKSLTETGLIALDGDRLKLITRECQCVILPDGRFAVAENNTGRLTRWIKQHYSKNLTPK